MKISISTLLIILFGLNVHAQNLNISLIPDKQNYVPSNYYVKEVRDSREKKGLIGKAKEGDILLSKGLESEIKEYIQTNPEKDFGITVHITELEIKEKNLGSKRQFDLTTGIAYYIGNSKLVEYKGSSYAQSNTNAAPYIEKLLKQAINNNLGQFDKWVGANKNAISATPEVEVKVYFSNLTDKKNHIPYSKSKKLYITDFEGAPDMTSEGAAATMSGVGMKYKSSTLRNKTTVTVTISVYFDKVQSWMKNNGKNTTTLMHEQRHFDITAIKACQLKERIESGYVEFSPENYQTQLSDLLKKIQEEGAEMQNLYDLETDHGTIIDEQEKWNKKIDALLDEQKCY